MIKSFKNYLLLVVFISLTLGVNFCFAADTWGSGLIQIIRNITTKVTQVGGALCTLMIVSGGIWYMLARDDAKQVGAAKAIVISALIGLTVILASNVLMSVIVKLGT